MQLKLLYFTKHLSVICFLMYLSIGPINGRDRLRFEIPILEGCEIIGHSNATVNDCGYCVGGETGLKEDYGKDCEGKCFGDAVIDCQGVCGGNAFVDECTGICMTADQIQNKEVITVNGSINRDCRGLCIPPELSQPQQQAYDRDECGICRLKSIEKSAFVDCNGNCQLPGIERVSYLCGQCIEKTAQVMDECGNCRNEKHICSCDKDVSICGCNDPNNCYGVKSVIPRAIPTNFDSKLLLLGYFHPVVRNLNCLLENEVTGDVLSFAVTFIHKNKTALECAVHITKEGRYVVSLGIIKNSINAFRKDFIKLVVFDPNEVKKSFTGTQIEPKTISTSDSNQTISLRFSDFSNSLFDIPFRCRVFYSKNNLTQLTDESNQSNSCALKPSSIRSESQILYISRTFDGINLLHKPFKVNITSPFPQISQHNCYVSEDGLAIIISFESTVSIRAEWRTESLISSLRVCESLLTNETIDYLSFYGLKSCFWSTKIQLIISVEKPISENSVHIKFRKNILRASDQLISLSNEVEEEAIAGKLSASPNWWSYEPVIAITGPSEIPDCGLFALIGHFSSPRGTTDVHFEWDIVGEVSTELKEHIENNGKSTNLILDAEFFEYHTPYKFIFRATIPVKEQPLEVGHTLVKLSYDSPIVAIYHTRLLQSTPLYSDEDIILLADVSVPECVFPVQKIILFWKVNDPRILFPLKDPIKRHSISFEVKPNSVPIDRAVDIYLNAFLGVRYNETSGARFTFLSSKSPLKANIANGFSKITIGSKSGSFILSSKPSKPSRTLVYQWSCHNSKTAQPCYYNFSASNQFNRKDTLLINRDLQRQSELTLESTSLLSNQNYWFGLQVFDKNDKNIFSETEYIKVKVVEGMAPQVFIGPLLIKGKHQVPLNARLLTYLVPERTAITVKGIVRPNKLIKSIRWEAPNGLFHLNWNMEEIGDQTHTQLYLHESQIHAFGSYSVKLIACNGDHLCSDVDISLMAVQSVSMCELTIESFTEYTLSLANVEKCNTPPNGAPLTYQLFLADESLSNPMPLSVPQFSSVIKFMGIPIHDPNRIARFGVQVCDRFGNCHFYYSASITIEQSANESSAISDLLKIAKRYQTAGDSIGAVSTLGTVLIKKTLSPQLTDKVINDSIEYSRLYLELTNQVLTEGHLAVIYSTLSNGLLTSSDTLTKRKLLALIQKYTQKAIALKTWPKVETIKALYSNLMKSFLRTESEKLKNFTLDKTLLEDIRNTFQQLKSVAASQIPLGTTLRLRSYSIINDHEIDIAITDIIHTYKVHDHNIAAKLSPNTTVEAKINFGEEIKTNYSHSWNCEQQMPCRSVIFSVTIYPNESPYPVKEESHRLSPIVDLSVHAPNSGKVQSVRGHRKAAKFHVTITGNVSVGGSEMVTLCHFYDEKDKEWKLDDVWPLGIVYNKAGCWSGHLSTFAVLRTVAGISADYVIGVFVACLMGVLVFGIMLVFFVQKKRDDNARIAPKPIESAPKKPLENPRYRQSKPNGVEIQTNASQSVLITD